MFDGAQFGSRFPDWRDNKMKNERMKKNEKRE
jgi:hypothetical protein